MATIFSKGVYCFCIKMRLQVEKGKNGKSIQIIIIEKTTCVKFILGFKVITFKNPYLGNTCVPFQHWVCSLDCARSLEVPARLEQIAKAQELDCRYEDYICKCTKIFGNVNKKRRFLSCVSSNRAASVASETDSVADCNGRADTYSSISTELSVSAKSDSSGKKCVLM